MVDLADEIAYNSHDLDDGLRAGFLKEKDLGRLALWREVTRRVRMEFGAKITALQKRRMSIRSLVNTQIKDIVTATQKRIEAAPIRTVRDALRDRNIVDFSRPFKKKVHTIKIFLMKNFYKQPEVLRMTDRGKRLISGLFRVYRETPGTLPDYIRPRIRRFGLERTICDYIAGMTDRFINEEYARLCGSSDSE